MGLSVIFKHDMVSFAGLKKIPITMTNQQKPDRDKTTDSMSVAAQEALAEAKARRQAIELAKEINGPKGLEPTRYGDWEAKGRCYDF